MYHWSYPDADGLYHPSHITWIKKKDRLGYCCCSDPEEEKK